jgi:phage/plasmid-associated DNA primase
MFNILDFVQLNTQGRAICPNCLITKGAGYRKYNLVVNLDPEKYGQYHCHRGCTTTEIRDTLGQSPPDTPPPQRPDPRSQPPKKSQYHSLRKILGWNKLLLEKSVLAKQWLLNRGVTEESIKWHSIGVTEKTIYRDIENGKESKKLPAIVIPYQIEPDKYLCKYFYAPWLGEDERWGYRLTQDGGLSSRWYFTRQVDDDDDKWLFICEGEWDSILMANKIQGFCGGSPLIDVCTSTTGCGGIPKDLSSMEKYNKVVIWYDLDTKGQEGAKALADAIGDRAVIATVPHPENPKEHWDVSDAFNSGFEFKDFITALDEAEKHKAMPEAKPEVKPESPEFADDETPELPEKSFNQTALQALYSSKKWICLNDTLYFFNGKYYQESPDPIERKRIAEYCNNYIAYDARRQKRAYLHANDGAVNAVLKWVKSSFGINPDAVNPSGLNLANGILSISWDNKTPKWALLPHTSERIYTYCSDVSYLPNSNHEACDRLLIALDDNQRDVFLKTVAASFDLETIRKIMPNRLRGLILQGDGSNGKDTLREAVSEIFARGITGCSLRDFQQYDEGKKFPLAKLEYSRINWASENHSKLSLDSLQSLKSILTGDPIDIERKNVDGYDCKPKCVVLLNCNEAPSIVGSQRAIESRYTILKLRKTFTDKPTSPDDIPADPRYKHDADFLRSQVCPALLNRLLESLSSLTANGIDYEPLSGAIQEARENSCHLIRWSTDLKITYGEGRIRLGDLYDSLTQWYCDQGILEVETTVTGKKKFDWLDEGSKYDPWVKAPRLMRQALTKVFPKVRFSERTEFGFFALGIQSANFVNTPNFAVFGSGQESNAVIELITSAEPKAEPNNFGSGLQFDSWLNQNSSAEPNFRQPEPNSLAPRASSEPKQENEPNFAIGDLVRYVGHSLVYGFKDVRRIVDIYDGKASCRGDGLNIAVPLNQLVKVANTKNKAI